MDGPGHRPRGEDLGWQITRRPTRPEMWKAIQVVLRVSGVQGLRTLRELSLVDP
ncbi:MAG: hypothetical protein GYA57_03005 [Myxococcales bacterium]|nr:hypothetical protein [Myxococcales bacterium]